VGTVALAATAALAVRAFPRPWVVFLFFAALFGPAVFCNALFHAGATVASRRYCPGVVTGLVAYLPLAALLAILAVRDGLIAPAALGGALLAAAVVHTLEVGHNVFKRW
jgi:hypothetical protein